MNLMQFLDEGGKRAVGVVAGETLRPVAEAASVYDIALAALTTGRTLAETIATSSLGEAVNRDAILARGVDDIAVLAVNDWHVMGAWAQSSGGLGKIHFLADWDAAFTKAVGLDADLSAGGLGVRSRRYSMLVEDGVVKQLNIEEGGKFEVSNAETLLAQLS